MNFAGIKLKARPEPCAKALGWSSKIQLLVLHLPGESLSIPKTPPCWLPQHPQPGAGHQPGQLVAKFGLKTSNPALLESSRGFGYLWLRGWMEEFVLPWERGWLTQRHGHSSGMGSRSPGKRA